MELSAIGSEARLRTDPLAVTRATGDMLDLTAPRHAAWDAAQALTPEDRQSYLSTLATLLQAGIVGIETLNVNGRPYTRFAELAIGDEQHRGAPQYRRFDLRA